MHQPTQSDVNNNAQYPGLKAPYGSLVAHAQLALKRQDIAECNRIVDWANEHPSSQRVLPVLQERRRQEQAASTLLRSSQVDEDTGERLLRPASDYACEEEQVDELLRPG
jgi:hypothetical protein